MAHGGKIDMLGIQAGGGPASDWNTVVFKRASPSRGIYGRMFGETWYK